MNMSMVYQKRSKKRQKLAYECLKLLQEADRRVVKRVFSVSELGNFSVHLVIVYNSLLDSIGEAITENDFFEVDKAIFSLRSELGF